MLVEFPETIIAVNDELIEILVAIEEVFNIDHEFSEIVSSFVHDEEQFKKNWPEQYKVLEKFLVVEKVKKDDE